MGPRCDLLKGKNRTCMNIIRTTRNQSAACLVDSTSISSSFSPFSSSISDQAVSDHDTVASETNLVGSLKNRLSYRQGTFASISSPSHWSGRCGFLKPEWCNLVSNGAQGVRFMGSQAALEPKTSDGLTVEGILSSHWPILDESESDWKSHAAAVAQSIHLIKKRLQWQKLVVRLGLLSAQVNKPDLWDDPVQAGKISREHGSIMGKMKEVRSLEHQLLEHIDMIKLARDENDNELESESIKALLQMRKDSKEKELQAMLSGEQDPCSCYLEVQAGAGGTESNDWAAMVMKMYKLWAQRRGYDVSVVDEMLGETAGIKRATIKVEGEYAFGYAKAEVGVHSYSNPW
uniref:Peptide chain release factor domain-containing protein n=1 Tax=Kalanchoe fedtschenkoi TaxID=63787 RepID=A0A7N0SVL1_KALFE